MTKNKMKTLYLIRHAKSEKADGSITDIERPLTLQGRTDAELMSKFLKSQNVVPDKMITSHAIRAISTAYIFAKTFKFKIYWVEVDFFLYKLGTGSYYDVISLVDNKVDTLLIFGHNPYITNLSNLLSTDLLDELPAAGIVGFSSECKNWKGFFKGPFKKTLYDYPKNVVRGKSG